ncbi:MAG: hypothetical protein RJB11_1541 [Planctomycetota bacterium]
MKAAQRWSCRCRVPHWGVRKALGQYRQIDIRIILGKIGFECISAHAQGFLKALESKPSGEGSRLTGQLALLRYHYSHPGFSYQRL